MEDTKNQNSNQRNWVEEPISRVVISNDLKADITAAAKERNINEFRFIRDAIREKLYGGDWSDERIGIWHDLASAESNERLWFCNCGYQCILKFNDDPDEYYRFCPGCGAKILTFGEWDYEHYMDNHFDDDMEFLAEEEKKDNENEMESLDEKIEE